MAKTRLCDLKIAVNRENHSSCRGMRVIIPIVYFWIKRIALLLLARMHCAYRVAYPKIRGFLLWWSTRLGRAFNWPSRFLFFNQRERNHHGQSYFPR